MKKWIFIIFSFILSFIILVTLMFELAFRLLKADEVINFMEKSVFIDSFNSWFIFLVILSFIGAIIISSVVFLKIKKVM
ncbi:TPA: hypothetical protein ACJTOG_004541 [Klebsiella aerogenes]|uniref:hypothetical protein n=1 Tax=Klebsiella TaxID=570 RepID=UPI00063CAB26|nr:hypothetical protein [Klebsiella aerogenes]EKZ5853999.1 hypothetical protein [Klebsiella aerogenes]EKZ6546298.1 hypothetical protein [Klebsiella aerogenes]EKZ6674940.1 hypothetical protein [Klebsiella aerogenes]KLF17162.1 hypothetical protein YA27_02515 [Klebsiella aerogenes]KZR05549.1 hypothetical protein A3N63_01045 [Klebsiella aerogenes]